MPPGHLAAKIFISQAILLANDVEKFKTLEEAARQKEAEARRRAGVISEELARERSLNGIAKTENAKLKACLKWIDDRSISCVLIRAEG